MIGKGIIAILIILLTLYLVSTRVLGNYTKTHDLKSEYLRCDTFLVTVWRSNIDEEKQYDSICNFIFEGNFKDTLSIEVSNILQIKKYAETNSSIGIIPEIFKIKNKGEEVSVEIRLHKTHKCISFTLRPRFRYCYISIDQNRSIWHLEYSNFYRTYR